MATSSQEGRAASAGNCFLGASAASYSSRFLNLGPVAATGCGARTEKPAQCPRGDWRILMLEKSEAKPSRAQGALLWHWQGARGMWEVSCREGSHRQAQVLTREGTHFISGLD